MPEEEGTGPEATKKKRAERISLHPLSLTEAVRGLLGADTKPKAKQDDERQHDAERPESAET